MCISNKSNNDKLKDMCQPEFHDKWPLTQPMSITWWCDAYRGGWEIHGDAGWKDFWTFCSGCDCSCDFGCSSWSEIVCGPSCINMPLIVSTYTYTMKHRFCNCYTVRHITDSCDMESGIDFFTHAKSGYDVFMGTSCLHWASVAHSAPGPS